MDSSQGFKHGFKSWIQAWFQVMDSNMVSSHGFKHGFKSWFQKHQLIELVIELQREKEVLKTQQDSQSILIGRITELERSHFLYEQYGRRECIEITAIPTDIAQEYLDEQVIKLYNETKVEDYGRELNRFDISACQQIGEEKCDHCKVCKQKVRICWVIQRKEFKRNQIVR